METTSIVKFLALALLTAPVIAGGVSAESNEEQTGRSINCSHADGYPGLVGRMVSEDGEEAFNTAIQQSSQAVTVDPSTTFDAWAEDGSTVVVDFFDESNQQLRSHGNTVPDDAAWASVCVVLEFAPLTTIPNSGTTFHYQDGL